MVPLNENSTKHWQTQSKALEEEISPVAYEQILETTAQCSLSKLEQAHKHAWMWRRQLIGSLEKQYSFQIPPELTHAINRQFLS